MARPISDEELQLKKRARRRLVGAIVLVSAVAVILPMVLDSEPKPVNQNLDIQIPPSDSAEFKPKSVAPVPVVGGLTPPNTTPATDTPTPSPQVEAAAPKASSAPNPDGTASGKAPLGAPAAANAEAAAPERSKPDLAETKQSVPESARDGRIQAKDSKTTAKEGTATTSSAYVVQVAALTDPSRAKQLQKQIAGAGVKTYTELVSTKSGEVTRVRAGPYTTREAAEKARTQLKKVGLDGKVVPR